jgi:hypothetical protein
MGFDNWKRFATGVKNNGVRRVPTSKKVKGAVATSDKMAQKPRKNKKVKRHKKPEEVPSTRNLDLKWRAESDADTLMRAKEVLDDQSRLKRARNMAEEKAKTAQAAAESIKQL